MYSRGDLKAGEKAELIHIEGDADHPTNRGTLCPKGAALKDFVKSETRCTKPRYRRPGSDRWEDISWEGAFDKIARILGLPGGSLGLGAVADITLIDPQQEFVYAADQILSKSRNTPFLGWNMQGRAVLTMMGGTIRHSLLA